MKGLMNIWDPWGELDQIHREMNRLFARPQLNGGRSNVYPAVNLWANETELVLTAEIPGLDPEKLDLTVNPTSISLKGTRELPEPAEGETFYRQERSAAAFERTLELPFEVEPQSADATYEKGVLTLKIARPAAQQPQKVTVKAS